MKIRRTLIVALLVFGIQGISYSQQFKTSEESEWRLWTLDVPPELTIDEIYDKTVRSVVWISTTTGRQGSGVLIDEKLRLVVTNHHVTKDSESPWVCFPVRDKRGIWIDERDFYTNLDNIVLLSRLGYAMLGRIVATDSKTDLALIQLDGLPDTAREIEHNLSIFYHAQMGKNDMVHIVGNPGEQKLWRWTAGVFQTVNSGMIEIAADIYKGNSGGPVLNDEGILIGIATQSNEITKTWAVPATSIGDLLVTLQPRQIFTIMNSTSFTVKYQSKWSEEDAEAAHVLAPGKVVNHWYIGASGDTAEGYPKITITHIGNVEVPPRVVSDLQTYTRHFGSEVEPTSIGDGHAYHFSYNSDTKRLDLSRGFPTPTANNATHRSWLPINRRDGIFLVIIFFLSLPGSYILHKIVIPKVKFRIREWKIKGW